MMALQPDDWLVIVGLGALWLGAQIVWVAPLPRQLRSGEVPTAPKGTPQAFGLFWIDQYGYIGLTLALGGVLLALFGWLR
ncbi:MAG: hypothetical protein RIB46_05545 [Pseudomonadales bacterium]